MLDVVSSIGEYQRLFYLKLPHLEFLSLDERIQIAEHNRDYCRAALRHQERITRELEARRASVPPQAEPDADGATTQGIANGLLVTQHMRGHWQSELAWVEQLVAQIMEQR